MAKRKTQRKRTESMKKAGKELGQMQAEWQRRLFSWLEILKNPPSDFALHSIADLLASLEFEPDEHGIPQGNWPPVAKCNPLVLLGNWAASYRYGKGKAERSDTLAWQADVLEAATLVWAGVDPADALELCPEASRFTIWWLLRHSDLEAFWNRPGVGNSADDIRERWERKEVIVDAEKIGRWLRRLKG
jgi:hypothetical protein